MKGLVRGIRHFIKAGYNNNRSLQKTHISSTVLRNRSQVAVKDKQVVKLSLEATHSYQVSEVTVYTLFSLSWLPDQ